MLTQDGFLNEKQVLEVIGHRSRSTLWNWVKDGCFPKPRKLGPRATGWSVSEINEWIQAKKDQGALAEQ